MMQALKSLCVKAVTKNKLMNMKVAQWHYSPNHREYWDGKWHLQKMNKYVDGERDVYDFPPPNYNLTKFIKHEIKGGWFENKLPWCDTKKKETQRQNWYSKTNQSIKRNLMKTLSQ